MRKKRPEQRPAYWIRNDAKQDANEDSRIKGATLQFFLKLCDSFNWKEGYAECSRSFVTDRVPISARTVRRAERRLLELSRITIVRSPVGRASTRYGINWHYRGADKIRAANDGQPILDCRVKPVEGTSRALVEGTNRAPRSAPNVPATTRRGDTSSPKPINIPQGGYIYVHDRAAGASALRPAPRAAWGATIETADVVQRGGDTVMVLGVRGDDDECEVREIVVEAAVKRTQDAGQRELLDLQNAAGIDNIEAANQFVGARVRIGRGGEWLPPT